MLTVTNTFLRKHYSRLDILGVCLSFACAVHCLAMPLLIVVLPLVGMDFLLNQTAERVFVIATILLAASNLCWSYKLHRHSQALLVFLAAAIMLISAIFIFPHSHTVHGESGHKITAVHGGTGAAPVGGKEHISRPQDNKLSLILLVFGAGSIAASHLLNRRLCKSCSRCKEHRGGN